MYHSCVLYLLIAIINSEEPNHPKSYFLKYLGQDEAVLNLFLKEDLGGFYLEEETFTLNGFPVWIKEEPTKLYLYRNDVGQWTISKHLTDPYGFIRKKFERKPSTVRKEELAC